MAKQNKKGVFVVSMIVETLAVGASAFLFMIPNLIVEPILGVRYYDRRAPITYNSESLPAGTVFVDLLGKYDASSPSYTACNAEAAASLPVADAQTLCDYTEDGYCSLLLHNSKCDSHIWYSMNTTLTLAEDCDAQALLNSYNVFYIAYVDADGKLLGTSNRIIRAEGAEELRDGSDLLVYAKENRLFVQAMTSAPEEGKYLDLPQGTAYLDLLVTLDVTSQNYNAWNDCLSCYPNVTEKSEIAGAHLETNYCSLMLHDKRVQEASVFKNGGILMRADETVRYGDWELMQDSPQIKAAFIGADGKILGTTNSVTAEKAEWAENRFQIESGVLMVDSSHGRYDDYQNLKPKLWMMKGLSAFVGLMALLFLLRNFKRLSQRQALSADTFVQEIAGVTDSKRASKSKD